MNVIVKVRFQGEKQITLTGEHGNKKSLVNIIETLITAKQVNLEKVNMLKGRLRSYGNSST